jgi:hypothetical protein
MTSKAETFELALKEVNLGHLQKVIFQQRFINVLKSFERRCFYVSIFFHLLRILVTVGSLIVPALLSIQYSDTSSTTSMKDPESFAYEIYWATWVISLLVTTSNGVVSVFKIDKKYFFLHTTMEQLKSEGWQYLELSGRYSGFHTPKLHPSHENQFIYFCHAVEKIKMHQVEEEYFKLTDSRASESTSQKPEEKPDELKGKTPLTHPTPAKSMEKIEDELPSELKDELNSMPPVDGASAPPLPVSAHVQTASTSQKGPVRISPNTEVPESVAP